MTAYYIYLLKEEKVILGIKFLNWKGKFTLRKFKFYAKFDYVYNKSFIEGIKEELVHEEKVFGNNDGSCYGSFYDSMWKQ